LREVHMDLCGVLGIDRAEVVRMRDSNMREIPEWEGPAKDNDPMSAMEFLPSDYFLAALSFYYLGDHKNCRNYAHGCVRATWDNFFGEWRQTTKTDDGKIDAPWWKKAMDWIEPLRYATMWGAAVGDWKGIEKLATYPDDECAQGKEGAEAKNFYLAVACHIRGDSSQRIGAYLQQATEGHAKRIRLLAQLFQAIRTDDSLANNALNEYLKYYKRRTYPNKLFDTYISIDGSLFYHLAKHNGIELAVDPQFVNYIVCLDA
jgi:hypothetical protein